MSEKPRSLYRKVADVVLITLVLVAFGQTVNADLYITGFEDGENTTIRFSGTLTLPPPSPNNVSFLEARGPGLISGPSNQDADTLRLGPLESVLVDKYPGMVFSSTSLQTIGFFEGADFSAEALSHSGDLFDITQNELRMRTGYQSGAALNGATVFRGTSLPIDLDTPRTLSLTGSSSKIYFNIPHPKPSLRIAAPRKTFRYDRRLVLRGISTSRLASLTIEQTGISGRKTRSNGGGFTWRVAVQKRILKSKRAVTIKVWGQDLVGNTSSFVKRRFRRK